MKQAILTPAVLLAAIASIATGSEPILEGIKLAPGERLVAIDGVPVDGATSAKVAARSTAPGRRVVKKVASGAEGAVDHATNIVGNLVRSGKSFSHSNGVTALDKANTERAKQGYGALIPDPSLQALALRKATIAAQRGYKNHIGGSLGGAKCEGVGFTNGRFLSCCLDERGTYGGAAMVQGRDGWYCCLLVR